MNDWRDQITECSFCRRPKNEVTLAMSCRKGLDGTVYLGALCTGCIRELVKEMAWMDPDAFEKLVKEARSEA